MKRNKQNTELHKHNSQPYKIAFHLDKEVNYKWRVVLDYEVMSRLFPQIFLYNYVVFLIKGTIKAKSNMASQK